MQIPNWVLFLMLLSVLASILYGMNKQPQPTPAPSIILAPTVEPPSKNVEFYVEPAEPDINIDVLAPAPHPPPNQPHHPPPPPPNQPHYPHPPPNQPGPPPPPQETMYPR